MAQIVLRGRLVGGGHVDVTYDEAGVAADELLEHVAAPAGLDLDCVRYARPWRTLSRCPGRRRAREAIRVSLRCAMGIFRDRFALDPRVCSSSSLSPSSSAGAAYALRGTLPGPTA
jgi:hypothetical protein